MIATTHSDKYAPERLAHASWEYDARPGRLTVTNHTVAVEVI